MSLTSLMEELTAWLKTTSYDQKYVRMIIQASRPLVYSPPSSSPVVYVGKAMLYALRYYCSENDYTPYHQLRNTLAWKMMEEDDFHSWSLNAPIERICLLAELDDEARRVTHQGLSPEERRAAIQDLETLIPPMLRRLPKGKLNNIHPRFTHAKLVGGADAGLLIDNTLWQTRTTTVGLSEKHIEQSVLYALLDINDEHRISSLGFMLPRQDAVVGLELGGLFKKNKLKHLRQQFLEYLERRR